MKDIFAIIGFICVVVYLLGVFNILDVKVTITMPEIK